MGISTYELQGYHLYNSFPRLKFSPLLSIVWIQHRHVQSGFACSLTSELIPRSQTFKKKGSRGKESSQLSSVKSRGICFSLVEECSPPFLAGGRRAPSPPSALSCVPQDTALPPTPPRHINVSWKRLSMQQGVFTAE